MELIKQSSTAYPLLFLMVDSADHITGKTGLSPTVTISKAGAAFGSPAGAVTELSSGWYKVAGNATDTGTLGTLILHATATGADPCDGKFFVVAFDPQSATAFITGINSLAPPTNWNLDSIDSSGRRDIGKILGTASAGTAGYMAPDWGHVNAPTTTVNLSGTTVGTATALTNAPSDSSGTTTLLARLTSARAGYLDTLNGIVAAIWAAVTDSSGVTTLLARLTGTRAGYLDNLSAAPPTLAAIRADLERNGGSLYNAGAAATAAANDTATIIDLIGAPAGVSIAEDIAAIDTGSGGASADEVVAAMTTAGFAKADDVRFDGIFPGQP